MEIKTIRKVLKISQQELACKMGVATETISRWENLFQRPRNHYIRLAESMLNEEQFKQYEAVMKEQEIELSQAIAKIVKTIQGKPLSEEQITIVKQAAWRIAQTMEE